MEEKTQVKEENLEYYEFLEALRKNGETNMFGASPYLQAYFGLDRREANEILGEWMENYNEINERFNIRERVKPLIIKRTTKIIFK